MVITNIPSILFYKLFIIPTAALEAPTAAFPRASAKSSRIAKFYLFYIPRPPETTMRALVNSGLSETMISSFKS